jgi:hypothetical protein
MTAARIALLLAAASLLAGCLEVEQHEPWRHGAVDGKPDDLRPHALFGNDRLAWYAAINNRNQRQNEYNRTPEKGGAP